MIKFGIVFLFFIFSASAFAQSISSLADSSNFYYKKGKLPEAISWAEKALAKSEKDFGKLDSTYASALNDLGFLYSADGNTKKAEVLLNESLAIRKNIFGVNSVYYASTLRNMARVYSTNGEKKKAETALFEVAAVFKKMYGDNNFEYLRTQNAIAFLYYQMAEYEKTIGIYKTTLVEMKLNNQFTKKDIADISNNLASAYNATGNFSKAEPVFLDILKLYDDIGHNHPDYATALNNMAILYVRIGDYEKSEMYAKQSLDAREKTTGKKTKEYANSLNSVAGASFRLGKYVETEQYYKEAIEILKNSVGDMDKTYPSALNNLAEFYKSTNRFSEAEPLLLEAIELRKKILGETHNEYANSLYNLGGLYCKQKEYMKGEPFFLNAVEIYKKLSLQSNSFYLTIISGFAKLYDSAKELSKAQPYYLESVEIAFKGILSQFSFLPEKEKELYLKSIGEKFQEFNAFAYKFKNNSPTITGTVYDYILKTKGLLLKSSTVMRNSILAGNDSILTQKYDQWTNLKKKITAVSNQPLDKRKDNLSELESKASILEKELVVKSDYIKEFENVSKLTWKEVQQALKPNEATIEFTHFKVSDDSTLYCALIVKKGLENPLMIPLFEENQLKIILDTIVGSDFDKINLIYGKKHKPNAKLYQLIYKPLEDYLKSIKKVTYSTSGLLNKISFASICSPKQKYLIDFMQLNEVNSTASVLSSINFSFHDSFSMEIFGGIKYSKISNQSSPWNYLEGTLKEADQLSASLSRYKIKIIESVDTLASETFLKNSVSQTDILHIATHGFYFSEPEIGKSKNKQANITDEIKFRGTSVDALQNFVNSKDPMMRSGIVLAYANDYWNGLPSDEVNNGILTAAEVVNMNFAKTQLVVLSSCESGLGDIKGTEGVYGLQRAFFIAGVKRMIVSLWQVPDIETAEFMTTFYNLLLTKKDFDSAFKETQQKLKKKYDPYFWGAFILLK